MQENKAKNIASFCAKILACFAVASFVTVLFESIRLYGYNCQGFDQSCFYTIGRGILNGKMPYVDYYDNKGPLTYLFFAFIALFDNYKISVFVAQLIINFISIIILGAFFKEIDAKRGRLACIILFFVYYVFISRDPGLYTEDIVMPLILLAYLFCYKLMMNYEKQGKLNLKYSYVISIAFWLVFLIRINNAIIIAGLLFSIGIMLLSKRRFKEFFSLILSFVVIGLLLCLPVALWLMSKNALYECLYQSFLINFSYSDTRDSVSKTELFFGFNNQFCFDFWGIIIFGLTGIALYFAKAKKNAEKWFSFVLLIALICSVVAISTVVHPYHHYFIATVAASFVPLIMYLSKFFHEDTKVNKYFNAFLTIMMVISLALPVLKNASDNIENNNTDASLVNPYKVVNSIEDEVFYEMGALIPKEDRDSVFAIDENPKFYALNKIQPCKRIFVCRDVFTYVNQDLRNEYYSYFEKDEPKWLVVKFGIEQIEDKELVEILQKKYELMYQYNLKGQVFYCLYRCC